MHSHNIHSLFVLWDGPSISSGIVTTYLMDQVFTRGVFPADIKSEGVMSYPAICVALVFSLQDCAAAMGKLGVWRLLVFNGTDIISVVSHIDINTLVKQVA